MPYPSLSKITPTLFGIYSHSTLVTSEFRKIEEMGMLKKACPESGRRAACGILALLPCSRTKRTLRASKRLRPFLRLRSGQDWTDWMDPSEKPSGHVFLNIPSRGEPDCLYGMYLPCDVNYSTGPKFIRFPQNYTGACLGRRPEGFLSGTRDKGGIS